MADDNNGGDKYDPEAERCCKDCGKTFKSKEGVLHGKYDFHCSPCHMWGKATHRKIYIGGGIFLTILVLLGILGAFLYLRETSKKKKLKLSRGRTKYDYDEDDDEYDD